MVCHELRDSGKGKQWPEDIDCALCGCKCQGTTGVGGFEDIPISVICSACATWWSYASQDSINAIPDWALFHPGTCEYINGCTAETHGIITVKTPPIGESPSAPTFLTTA